MKQLVNTAYKIKRIVVPYECHNTSLLDFLVKNSGFSKQHAAKKILSNEVMITESAHAQFTKSNKPSQILHAGDVVKMSLLNKSIQEKKISLESLQQEWYEKLKEAVLYKDQNILVLNKPVGLPVQGGSKVDVHLESILGKFKEGNYTEIPRLVHRLDRNTSGVFILARTREYASTLCDMFQDPHGRIIKKYYGWVSPCLVDLPVGHTETITSGLYQVDTNKGQRIKSTHWIEGDNKTTTGETLKKAVTEYTILKHKNEKTLIEFRPLTGRKHQIRIHASSILNSPIVGDMKYGVKRDKSEMNLHLKELILKNYYAIGKDLVLTAPVPFSVK